MNSKTEDKFRDHRTKVLFVLVGENPLPNYVAARLLLETGGHLYLVHSKGPAGTGDIAKRLSKRLTEYKPELIPVDEFDADELRIDIAPYLARVKGGRVGLNYTGGTKFMAVHTYRAMRELCNVPERDVILSYLHADTLQLTVEPRSGNGGLRCKVVDEVKLGFEDVFALHDIESVNEGQEEPQFPNLARAVAEFQCSPEAIAIWRDGVTALQEREGEPWRSVQQALTSGGLPASLLSQMQTSFGLADDEPLHLDVVAERTGVGSAGSLGNWLKWEWLEDWVLTCLSALKIKPRVKNQRCSAGGAYFFEIDAAFMRGYQLFMMSCKDTTSRKTAKLGLMEAFARARQMGGEESRAALVTTYADADGLKAEFAADWGGSRRVRIFGCRELPDLQTRLQAWHDKPEAGD